MKQLWAAILIQAIDDIKTPKSMGDKAASVDTIREEAIGYIFSADSDEAFSHTGINASLARKRLAVLV